MPNDPQRQILRQYYDQHALERAGGETLAWKVTERAAFLALLQAEGKSSLLELGAGHGRDSLFFQQHGLSVQCIDLSPVMADLCRQQGLQAQAMDMADLRFEDHSFDAIYALNSLLHLTKAEFPNVLAGMRRVLRPSGLVYLGVYGGIDREGIWEDDLRTPKRFFSYYTDEGIQAAVSQVFHIHSFKHIPMEGRSGLHFQSLILRCP